MTEIASHKALEQIWEVCGAANRYVDAQAPWALRKSDPARMATVLWVLAETVRRPGVLTQPFMPDASAQAARSLVDPAGRAHLRCPSRRRCAPGTALPPPGRASSRATSSPRSGMIVDSHCHLNSPGLAEDEAGVIERAESRGRRHHGSYRGPNGPAGRSASRWPSAGPKCSARSASHPHEAGKEGLDDPAPLIDTRRSIRVWLRSARAASTTSTISARVIGRPASFRTHIAAARHHEACRWSFTPATPTTTPMALLESEMGPGPSPASSTATARAAASPNAPRRSASILASAVS